MSKPVESNEEQPVGEYSMPSGLQLGPVHLAVSNLDRAVDFYGRVLGIPSLRREGDSSFLGTGEGAPLLQLEELPGARPKPPHTTGLYHFAILLPSRGSLAATLAHLAELSYPLQGAADHRVSEALYLSDPDGNGIEIYADRPRDAWTKRNGDIEMTTEPLDIDGLMEELDEDRPWDGMPTQTRIGHIHLQVNNLVLAEAYYRDFLGLQLMQRYGAGALFLSAGGYHHHIGLNTWAGTGATPPPPDAVGLRDFTLLLPERADLEELARHAKQTRVPFVREDGRILLRDPFGNGIVVDAL